MIPLESEMLEIVSKWEEHMHSEGWDCAPTLAIITATDDRENLLVAMTPVQPADVHQHPVMALRIMVKIWESGVMEEKLNRMDPVAADSLVGLVLTFEAWTNTAPPDERDGRQLADIPGSYETRNVIAVDCGGRGYWASRRRGQKPEFSVMDPDAYITSGEVVESLVRLLKAMVKFAPAQSRDLLKLNALLRAVKPRGASA